MLIQRKILTATGLGEQTHSVKLTSANVSDVDITDKCLHGKEQYVFGDAGYHSFNYD